MLYIALPTPDYVPLDNAAFGSSIVISNHSIFISAEFGREIDNSSHSNYGGVVAWIYNWTALLEHPVLDSTPDNLVQQPWNNDPKESLVLPALVITCMLLLIPAGIVGESVSEVYVYMHV